jgi:hypothetical protein
VQPPKPSRKTRRESLPSRLTRTGFGPRAGATGRAEIAARRALDDLERCDITGVICVLHAHAADAVFQEAGCRRLAYLLRQQEDMSADMACT